MKAALTATVAAVTILGTAHALPAHKRCSPFDVFPIYYANDTQHITYSPGWTILTGQGSFDRGGVEAYSNTGNGNYTFTIPQTGTLQIHAGKKFDRGYSDAYVNGPDFLADNQFLGVVDEYNSACRGECPQEAVFTAEITEAMVGKNITVRSRPNDDRFPGQVPFTSLNYVIVRDSNC